MLGKLLPFLGSINKAWFGGVVAFLATYVLAQFTGIQIDGAQIDAFTNVGWYVLQALGAGAAVATAVYAIPNTPDPAKVVEVPVKSNLSGDIIGTQKAQLFGLVSYVPTLPDTYNDPLPEATELDNEQGFDVGVQPVDNVPVPTGSPEPAAEPVSKTTA
jgi:hypothetical protein